MYVKTPGKIIIATLVALSQRKYIKGVTSQHLHYPIVAFDFFSPPSSSNNLILVSLFDHLERDGTCANVC